MLNVRNYLQRCSTFFRLTFVKAKPVAILDARRLNEISQAELARRAIVTPSYLCRIEKGEADGTIDVLRRLAAALGVSVETITEPDGEFRPSRKPRKTVAA